MELWDLYTRDRRLTGETHIRGEKLPPERYHLVVHVWIRNSRGEWLISQRAASRPTFPLMWECVGGSVTTGEDSLTGAIREAKEEVGVDLDPASGRMVSSTVRDHFQDIKDDWLFLYDGPIDLSAATQVQLRMKNKTGADRITLDLAGADGRFRPGAVIPLSPAEDEFVTRTAALTFNPERLRRIRLRIPVENAAAGWIQIDHIRFLK